MIYLDNAATSYPKPQTVTEEVERALRVYGGNPGRGSHPLALAASERIFACREALSHYLDSDAPERVIFTMNATYALNFCIKGLIPDGAHILLSDLEHNAVWRPVEARSRAGEISYDIFPTFAGVHFADEEERTAAILAGIRSRLTPRTRAVVCTHASNIVSYALPAEEIGAFCRQEGLFFILDISQSAGHIPVSMKRIGASALCGAGHKGLFGIQGCGFALFGADCLPEPLIEGGSGYQSLLPTMPETLPEREEAGTLPTPAIGGLWAGIRWLENLRPGELYRREEALYRFLREALHALPDYRIYCPEAVGTTGTLLFSHEHHSAAEVGVYLAERGICVRTGHHCAALAHRTLKTPPDGAVRVSFGAFSRHEEVEQLLRHLRELHRR